MGDTGPEHEIEVLPAEKPVLPAPVAPPTPVPVPQKEPEREPVPV